MKLNLTLSLATILFILGSAPATTPVSAKPNRNPSFSCLSNCPLRIPGDPIGNLELRVAQEQAKELERQWIALNKRYRQRSR